MLHYPNDQPFGLTLYENCANRPNKRTISFSPLLSIQRYLTVKEVICKFAEQSSVSTVAEFGSNTFTFFLHHLLECSFIDTVHQIDIDEERIHSALHVISTEKERRFRVIKGRKPLTVNIFKGNVTEKDDRVLNSDVVVGIELIEHLTERNFDKFPETIFGFMKPKLIVLTTPNYDFNVLFENGGVFRNDDHKFEFTRAEFQSWANSIILKYSNYSVQIYGIGEPPDNCSLDVGFCSQMAIFQRLQPAEQPSATPQCSRDYTLIGSYSYFTFERPRRVEDDVFEDVAYACKGFGSDNRYVEEFSSKECDCHRIEN